MLLAVLPSASLAPLLIVLVDGVSLLMLGLAVWGAARGVGGVGGLGAGASGLGAGLGVGGGIGGRGALLYVGVQAGLSVWMWLGLAVGGWGAVVGIACVKLGAGAGVLFLPGLYGSLGVGGVVAASLGS